MSTLANIVSTLKKSRFPSIYNTLVLPFLLFFSLLSPFQLSHAKTDCANAISVDTPFARNSLPGQSNSAAFMKLTNQQQTDCKLTSALSPAAKIVELHTHIHENGLMKMREVASIDIPALQSTHLKRGGLHIMLIDIVEALKAGQTIELTLSFDDGSQKKLNLPVKDILNEKHHH